jgi:N-acetylglucosamine kinase-like BadF-type ATPase
MEALSGIGFLSRQDADTMTKSVLAIDGGGSKTLVAIADASGTVTRLAAGAGVNPMDNPQWRQNLAALLDGFAVDRAALAAAVAALPSYGEVAAVSALQRAATAALLDPVSQRLVNDVDAAHLGAFAGGPGILLLAGTGSMAWARDAAGASYRVGGWGEGFGDEGSGYWIGLRAVQLASQHLDGRTMAPGLVDGLFAGLGLDRTQPHDSLAGWFGGLTHRRSAVAAVALFVDALARRGDPTALAILDAAAEQLALHATAIARTIGAGAPAGWSYAGGAFHSHLLRDAVARRLGTPPQPPRLPPIGGALLAAATDAGWPIDDAWIDRLATSLGRALPAPAESTAHPNDKTQRGEQGYA